MNSICNSINYCCISFLVSDMSTASAMQSKSLLLSSLDERYANIKRNADSTFIA